MRNLICSISAIAAIAAVAGPSIAFAQATDSPFYRDRSVNVTQRAKVQYAPLGIRAFGFSMNPVLGTDLEMNDNVLYRSTGEEDDIIFRLRPSITGTSTWSRHKVAFEASSAINRYSSNDSENTTDFKAAVEGRYDITSRANVFGNIAHATATESRAFPSSPFFAAEPVQFDTTVIAGGTAIEFNRLRFVGRVANATLDYDDVPSRLGGTLPQDQRDMEMSSASARVDYALSPDTALFGVYEVNNREYRSLSGRDSKGYNIAVGASFDLTDLLRGEFQIGRLSQEYDNSAFGTQESTSYNGKVEWFPTQLTTVTFRGQRSIEETPEIGSFGVLTSTASVAVDHELLRNLILSGSYGMIEDDYRGYDRQDSRNVIYLGANYLLSRRFAVNAGYTRTKLESSGANAFALGAYENNSIRIGLTVSY